MTIDQVKSLLSDGFLDGVARTLDLEGDAGASMDSLLGYLGENGIRSDRQSLAEDARNAFAALNRDVGAR